MKQLLKINFILLISLSIICSQCYKEIEIDLPTHKPIPVINCLYCVGKPFQVILTFTALSSDSLSWYTGDATIIISSPTQTDTLQQDSASFFLSRNIIAQSNTPYKIMAIIDGYPIVEAYDTTPNLTSIQLSDYRQMVYINEDGNQIGGINLNITDLANNKDYYSLSYYAVYNYDNSLSSIFGSLFSNHLFFVAEDDASFYPTETLLSDNLFDGNTINIPCLFDKLENNYGYNDSIILPLYYCFFKRNASANYYKYIKSHMRHHLWGSDWSNVENIPKLYSNVNNGLGIFAGFIQENDTIYY